MASEVQVDWRRFEVLKAKLGEMKQGFDSPKGRACIEKCREIAIEDNRDGLLRGLDKNGVRMHELAPSTLAHRDGTGEPLSPHDSASRVIANFTAAEHRSGSVVTIRVGWTGIPWLIFHKRGTRHLPIRDIVGIRPAGRQRIKDTVKAFQRNLVKGNR